MSRSTHAPLFYGRHFPDDIISLALRWYLRYSLSYRDLKEILAERGVSVDHSTIWRWVDRFAPELERRLRPHLQPRIPVWRVDETYVRVAGEWTYLYRAVDGRGATVEFYLSRTRDVESAKLFLRKAMADQRLLPPVLMVTDGNPTYPIAVRELQREKKLPLSCRLRISHSENNLIEQDIVASSGGPMPNNTSGHLAAPLIRLQATKRCIWCGRGKSVNVSEVMQ